MRPHINALLAQCFLIAISVAYLFAGCSTATITPRTPSQLTAPLAAAGATGVQSVIATEAVISAEAEIWIRYLDGELEAVALAPIPSSAQAAVQDAEQSQWAAAPDIVSPTLSAEPYLAGGGAPVLIRPTEDWQALVSHLATEAVSLVPGRGVVLDVLRQQELLLLLDDQGDLRALPLTEKPAGIEPDLTLTLTELLQGALPRIRHETPGVTYLLFNSGDPTYPFVLLLLDRERVLFLQRPRAGSKAATIGPAPAHAAQAAYHTLTSQVRSVTTQPISTLAQFVSGLGTTAVDTLPRLQAWDDANPPPPLASDPIPMDLAGWERELDILAAGSGTFGRIEYLVDGEAFFPALIHQISAADLGIRIRLYIFDNDDYAVKVADLLKARSADVPVEILLDGLGTITSGMVHAEFTPEAAPAGPASIAAYLRAGSGVRVRMLPNPWMQGDHTKVLIFDDRIAFLGGMNIGREYRYEWHDLMVALEGPVVDRLGRDFDLAWTRAGLLGELRAVLAREAQQLREPGIEDYPVRLLYTKPGDSQILRTHLAALRNVRQRVWIQNAYLTSDAIVHELIAARRRGVDVRIILPYRTDAGFIGRSNVLAANLMLRHGIRVYIYPGMSHVKAAVYDGWASLGSANFDRLSLRLNKETNIATSHRDAVAGLVGQVFEPDFARAVELREPLPVSWLDYLKELIADQL